MIFSLPGQRIWIAGHRGMVGSALVRRLQDTGCTLITADRATLDLRDAPAVDRFIASERPDAIVLAAAKVGGILANDRFPADFLLDNLLIQTGVLQAAHRHDVPRLLFLGSSCIYPRDAAQPIAEDALLSGPLEPTNEAYAIAKIAGLKLAQAFNRQHGRAYFSAMPCNLYGPGDNFDLLSSHVVPALIRKAHEAKASGAAELVLWGSGTPRREFLHVDDCADALVFLLQHAGGNGLINVGAGADHAIRELADLVCRTVGFTGRIVLDPTKPDGTPRKLMDSSRLNALGWRPRITLPQGLIQTYQWFLEHHRNNP